MINIMILTMNVILLSCSADVNNQHSTDEKKASIQKLITDWKTDSTGCLKLRNYETANTLVEELKLNNSNESEVENYLGRPNERFLEQVFIPSVNEDRDFIHLIYYFDIQCNNGQPTPNKLNRCWLLIIIHPDTHKVVSIGYPCS